MLKTLSTLVAGVLVGVLVMVVASNNDSRDDESRGPVRDIVKAPAMTQAAADMHREERYAKLSSIEEIMALPTEFARAEALYALAGRSGSGAVQSLIFEADRVSDDVEREQLLSILFFRLTEIDPRSALALVRTGPFTDVKALERTVWGTWARKNFDDALFAAKAQFSIAEQKAAAQSLYAAFGYMGNEMTDRIESELGIRPDRSTRARYLYRLADRSPAMAIEFINSVTDESHKRQYVSWLAYYLSLSSPEDALRHASLFDTSDYTQYFEQIVRNNLASENPRETIERLIASGRNPDSSNEFYSAVRALAKSDTEAAMLYFEQVRSDNARRNIGSAIAAELARKDPVAALAWARENELDSYPILQMTVLGTIASSDPQRAMDEALALPNSRMKSQLVSRVIQQIANSDPIAAVAYLDEIANEQQKLEASQNLLHTWMRRDAGAAMEWVLDHDDAAVADLVRAINHDLVENNIDIAIRILPRLERQEQDLLKMQIANRLASRATPGEAQSFIRQFEGEPGYDQLQTAVIGGIAQDDVYTASQLAAQLPAGGARDSAYVTVIAQHAETNPSEAARWLSNIDDVNTRGHAAGQIAAAWHSSDPSAANRWVSTMPAGTMRDNAVAHLASRWHDPSPEQQAMINGIEDPGIRGRAKMSQIYRLMRSDPARARQLLQDEDIPAHERQRMEMMMSRGRRRF